MTIRIEDLVRDIPGPVLVTGAGGFIGAQLTSFLQHNRPDVYGTARSDTGWRFDAFGLTNVYSTSTSDQMIAVLDSIRPRTIFNLAAHGAYSFQTSTEQITATNFVDLIAVSDWAEQNDCSIVQAGTSSEYGWNCEGPTEDALLEPNSLYAVTKAATANYLGYRARVSPLAACVLRLYSVYGPGEDPGRLFPVVVRNGLDGGLPDFADPEVSRDYVHIADVIDAFVRAALLSRTTARGSVINICTGVKTSMSQLSQIAINEFDLDVTPRFGAFSRPWDLRDWYGNPELARTLLHWEPQINLTDGLHQTRLWYGQDDHLKYLNPDLSLRSVTIQDDGAIDISAVIACYRDGQAIPYMYERLKQTFTDLNVTYEIIFVNDASPDDSLTAIEELSMKNKHVKGITHSRNFGSQAAFLSGMRESTGRYVVLLDGDLQDPPELIADFWAKKDEGFDVVYGRRVDRDASWIMRRAYKGFYRVFQALAPFNIPRDAGDFSLMSREVVDEVTAMPERDLFIRAQRAYAGFRQAGVDYKRPERMFGTTTNSLRRNLGWATRGVLAVSRAPLTALSLFALGMFVLSVLLIVAQLLARVFIPSLAPEGFVSITVLILGLGSLNLLAIAIVGEYVGRILEETKRRPRYVRRLKTQFGRTRSATALADEGSDLD